MKERIVVSLAAAMAIVLLTAGTTRQTQSVGMLSDQQMSVLVGGEKEKSCVDQFIEDSVRCAGLSTEEERDACAASASFSYLWCRLWSMFSWIVSLFF